MQLGLGRVLLTERGRYVATPCGCRHVVRVLGRLRGPTIDGTSDQTLHDSMAVMTKGMNKKDENKFRMACFIVAASKSNGTPGAGNASQESQLRSLSGMTKDQITDQAALILEQNKQRRK